MVVGGDYGFAGLGLSWVGLAGGDCGFAVGLFLFGILVVTGWVVVAVGVCGWWWLVAVGVCGWWWLVAVGVGNDYGFVGSKKNEIENKNNYKIIKILIF